MAKTAKKREVTSAASIKRRLSAAIVMLLVSTIMLVASTYAWFTLSTAPEVRNIDTKVAGNGSLEIALMPADGDLGSINSGRASETRGGVVAVETANTTWGNIVELDVDDVYGLDNVTLNPALVAVDTQNMSISFSIPEFGYDGRITAVNAQNVLLKSWVEAQTKFAGTDYGVRAFTVTSGNEVTTYGYAIDLAFRVNTTNNGTPAKLMLQKDAAERLEGALNTAGNGSYLTLGNGAPAALADGIRIAFVQNFGNADANATATFLAYAKATGTNGQLELYDATGALIDDDVILGAMAEDTAYQISALVWLDGDGMTNASLAVDQAIDAVLSLQFTTDVALVPASTSVADATPNP